LDERHRYSKYSVFPFVPCSSFLEIRKISGYILAGHFKAVNISLVLV
jgi:hypothetical protein